MVGCDIENGADINKRNKLGFRSIESSVEFYSANFVNEMIKLGAEINDKMIFDDVFPSIKNNDLLSFATQQGKKDIVELLMSKNAPVQDRKSVV